MEKENNETKQKLTSSDEKFVKFKETLKQKGVDFTVVNLKNRKRFFADGKKIADVRHKRKFSVKSKYFLDNTSVDDVETEEDIENIVNGIIEKSKINTISVPVSDVVSKSVNLEETSDMLIPEDFVYIPRKVETDETDLKEFEDAMKQQKNVLLEGPTGSGKTSLVRKYCAKYKKPYKRISLNGGVTVEDLVGHYILKSGESPWVDGILTRSAREGWVLAVDEINSASPEVLFVLNSLLDDERILILSAKDGEVIKPHADFRLIATMNPSEQGYAGTNEMNQALVDRFHVILNIDYNKKVEEKILKQMGLDSEQVSSVMEFTNKVREAYAKSEIFTPWSTRSVINFAENLLKGKEKLTINRFKASDRDTVRDLMDTFIYKSKPVADSNGDSSY